MRVCFVTPYHPMAVRSGARTAALHTLRAISGLCELHLLVPEPGPGVDGTVDVLPGVRVHVYPDNRFRRSRLQLYGLGVHALLSRQSYWILEWANDGLRTTLLRLMDEWQYDVIHCEWLRTAVAVGDLDLPILTRTLDVHYVMMRDWAVGLAPGTVRRWFWRLQAERFRRFELATLRRMPRVIAVSAEDRDLLEADGVANVTVIPPPRPLGQEAPPGPPRERVTALFLGRLDMAVNREAFFRFADEVWPHVDRHRTDVLRVTFAGGVPDEAVFRRGRECGFEIVSPVSDADADRLMIEADIFISPVASGTGIKMKTLEALAYGRPMVGFPGAFRGVPVEHFVHALVADTADDFARLLLQLAGDRELRLRLARAGRELLRTHFDPGTLGARLVRVYTDIGNGFHGRGGGHVGAHQ